MPFLHLVRHGAAENPDEIVYGRLDGYPLSETGRSQADAVAAHLAHAPLRAVRSSPLQRALETATSIAKSHGLEVEVDERLTEWGANADWWGERWTDLPHSSPDRWSQFLERPWAVETGETIEACARRVAAAVRDGAGPSDDGEYAVVSHRDPLRAGLCLLTGLPFERLLELDVFLASVTTVRLVGARAGIVSRWQAPGTGPDPLSDPGRPPEAERDL